MIFIHTLIIYDKSYMPVRNSFNVIKVYSSQVILILSMKSLIIEEEKSQISDKIYTKMEHQFRLHMIRNYNK